MATVSLQGSICNTVSDIPETGNQAPDFCLIDLKLKEKCLADFSGKKKIIYTVPSIDTQVCAITTKILNELASKHTDCVFLLVSADLPFAQQRFVKQNKLKNIIFLSMMKSKQFAEDYGVLLVDGPLAGLASRAIFIIDENDVICYQQLVADIASQPDFDEAMDNIIH